MSSLFQRVGDERQNLLILIQQQHDPQISQPLITESGGRYQFQTFYLTEMSRISEHVDIEEFGDIVMSSKGIFLFERRL